MGKIINFDRLIEDGDIPGLVTVLRNPADADLRETAARALGDLGDMSAVEALIRSNLQDPDPGVRKAARTALEVLAGGQAGLAISSFGPLPADPWLVESEAFETPEAEGDEEEESYQADLEDFIDAHDLPGLVACLRHPGDTGLRLAAAEALGELDDPQAIEYLLRATIEDPEAEVRQAAYGALEALSGANAALAVATYRSSPPARDAWLEEPEPGLITIGEDEQEEGDLPEDSGDMPAQLPEAGDAAEGSFSKEDIDGLVRIVAGEPDIKLRLKAIRALQQIPDMRSVDILAYSTLHSDVPAVRKAAHQALYEIFGQDAAGVIKSYQQSDAQAGEEDNEEDEEEDEAEGPEDSQDTFPSVELAQPRPSHTYPAVKLSKPEPVIQEEGFPWWLLAVVGGIVLLVILLLVFIK